MRFLSTILLTTTAAAFALPATAQDRAVPCDQEVAAFLETLRADETFPLIEAAFADLEADLVEAVESDEGTCFAILAEVQTALFDEGYVVEGATDRRAVDRIRRTARLTVDEADVAVETQASAVEVGPGETDVAVRQPEPEVTVRQASPDVTVSQAEPEVTIVGPDEEVEVVEEQDAEAVSATDAAEVERQARGTGEVAVVDELPEPGATVEPDVLEVERSGEGQEDRRRAAPREALAEELEGRIRRLTDDTVERRVDVEPDAAAGAELDVEAVAAFEAFAVREVEFPFDSATVPLTEAARVLDEVAALVEEEPDSAVLLTGYASPIGGEQYNLELSEARVEAVRDALVDLGVPDTLIRTRSLGERNTEVQAGEGERSPANRRVEIRVLDMSDIAG